MTCYLGITCWEARHSLLDSDCMQGIQMWHIRWGLDARTPDVTPELQGGVRNRQPHRGCIYFGMQVPSWPWPWP